MWQFLATAALSMIKSGLSVDAAQARANSIRAETFENWRRIRRQQLNTLGQAQVAGAASGVDAQSYGLQQVLLDMEAEQKRQAQWLVDTGRAEATAIDRAATLKYVSDLGQTFFSFGSNMGFGGGGG